MASGVAGAFKDGDIRYPETLEIASRIAHQTEMPNINGGSPTALERAMVAALFGLSSNSMVN
jgi:hypothetical protein